MEKVTKKDPELNVFSRKDIAVRVFYVQFNDYRSASSSMALTVTCGSTVWQMARLHFMLMSMPASVLSQP